MVTIRQIAERCGVSASTVSKALNGAEDVSVQTAKRIRAVAEEMGYMPNAAARALKTRRSYILGILFAAAAEQGLTHEFFSRILNSFKTRAGELGYDICFISDHLGRRRIGFAEHARYRNVDGVLVVVGTDADEPAVPFLAYLLHAHGGDKEVFDPDVIRAFAFKVCFAFDTDDCADKLAIGTCKIGEPRDRDDVAGLYAVMRLAEADRHEVVLFHQR